MGVGDESRGEDGLDAFGRTAEFQMVLAVAEALRRKFDVGIDAHPGGQSNQAGVVNRAFRAAAKVIIAGVVPARDDPAAFVTWALRQVALRCLAELDVDERWSKGLLDSEPDLGDRWPAYLALAPASVISALLGSGTD